jgi:hypothetical protein
LAGAAVAGTAVASPVAAARPEDPHLGWERQLPAIEADMAALPEGESYDAAWARWIALQDQICLTPATTPAGIAAQVRRAVITTVEGSTLSDAEVEGLRNAVRSLAAMAGVPDGLPVKEEEDEARAEPLPVIPRREDPLPRWVALAETYRPVDYDADEVESLVGRTTVGELAFLGAMLRLMGDSAAATLPQGLRTAADEWLNDRLKGREAQIAELMAQAEPLATGAVA